MKYYISQIAIMEPDLYSGESYDQVRPRWMTNVEKEGKVEIPDSIILSPHTFPPGTRVTIEVPVCPNCDLDADYAINGKCPCGFDWYLWRDNQYS